MCVDTKLHSFRCMFDGQQYYMLSISKYFITWSMKLNIIAIIEPKIHLRSMKFFWTR